MCSVEREQRSSTEVNQARLFYFISHHVFQLNQLVRCSICFDIYERPTTVFHCFHVFCEDCIKTYLDYSTAKEPPCPICQKPIPRNDLRPNNVLAQVAKFVSFARRQIDTALECDVSKLPSFETILTKIKEKNTEISPQSEGAKSINTPPPPDYGVILKARKILIKPNNEVLSTTEELPRELPSVSFRDGSLKTPSSHKRNSAAIQPSVSKKKDLFDAIKAAPMANPFFKRNKLNEVTKTYKVQKQPEKENRNNAFADKIIRFEDDSNKVKIIQWLSDSRNKFDSTPQTQEKNVPELQFHFDMPSVSQRHQHKIDPVNVPLLSQINRQKCEQDKIRQRSNLVTHLSRTDFSTKTKQHRNDNRRTRSLESYVKTVQPNQKLKRHSISVPEKIIIEQFNSEDEVLNKSPLEAAIVNLIEEECLRNLETNAIQQTMQNKPKIPTKQTKKKAVGLRSPKKSRRLSTRSSKLLQAIEETNNRLNKTSSGWARMKDMRKTIRKVEIKPKKLIVSGVSRCSSTVTSTAKEAEASSKNLRLETTKIGKSKGKVEPVVLLERMNFNNVKSKGNVYDLDVLESYFSKQLGKSAKVQKELGTAQNKTLPDGDSTVGNGSREQLQLGNVKNKLLVTAVIHNVDQDKSKDNSINVTAPEIEKKTFPTKNEEPSTSKFIEKDMASISNSFKREKSKLMEDESKINLDQITKAADNLPTSTLKSRKKLFDDDKPRNVINEAIKDKDQSLINHKSNEEPKKKQGDKSSPSPSTSSLEKPKSNLNSKSNEGSALAIEEKSKLELQKFAEEVVEIISKTSKNSSSRAETNSKSKIVDDYDEIFMLPTQVILGKEKENQRNIPADDDEIFTMATQLVTTKDTQEMEPQNKSLESILKRKIQSLQDILTMPNFLSQMKILLGDIEQTISKEESQQQPVTHKLINDAQIQTDFKESSFFSHDATTQTVSSEPKLKNAGMQTDSCGSSRGFRISSTDLFHTQAITNTEMQTDAVTCPKCSFLLGNDSKITLLNNPTTISSDALLRDSNIKSLSEKYVLTGSFDHIDFETQDVVKGRDIKGSSTFLKGPIATQNGQNKENDCQNNIEPKEPAMFKKLSEFRLPQKSNLTPNFALPSQICNKTPSQRSYKRIRKPTSDSDSDDGLPKNAKKNKFIQDDLSLHFASESQKEIPRPLVETTEVRDEFLLSEESDGIDYGEYLQNVLKKCDEELMSKKSTPNQKSTTMEPPAKRSKTQDMIEECKLILQQACSGAITIENTEHFSTARQDVPKPTKLTLTTLEEEFRHNFSGDGKGDVLETDKDCEMQVEARNKFSESLFSTADPFSKTICNIPVPSQPSARLEAPKGSKNGIEKENMKNETNRLVAQSSLDQLIDVMDEFDDSFEDDTEEKIKNKNATAIKVENETLTEQLKNLNTGIKILQNIVIPKNNEIAGLTEDAATKPEKEPEPVVDNKGNESDDMFLSDSDVVETTPQKSKPVSIEKLPFLSQAYYNPEEKIILPPLVDESPDVISSLDPPPFTCLGQVFVPPPEFQDTLNDKTLVNNKQFDLNLDTENANLNGLENENQNSVIDLIHSQVDTNRYVAPSSSLTPDLILPQTNQLNCNVLDTKERFITSTPYTEDSQILPSKSLNLSPIRARESYRAINPILAAQKSKFSPLTLRKTPPPQRHPILATSTPKQKSILNYVRPSENGKTEHGSQSSQKSVMELTPINKPCVACTRMSKEQLLAITSLSNKKLISFSNIFSSTVTHMIVDVNHQNRVKDHTMKFVCAVAAGIWVLNFTWVEESLKMGRLLPEEPFEALDMSGIAGPQKSRLARNTDSLLKGYKIHAAPPFKSTTQKEVENVIRLLGGEVVPRLDDLIPSNGKVCLIITEAKESEDFDMYEMWLDMLKVATVDLEWLSRSVGQYERLSLKPFTLCSEESICDLGYPAELLTDVPISFSHTNTM